MFWEFIFKLFRLEWEEKVCLSCEHLKMLIESEKREKKQILDLIVAKNEPEKHEVPSIPLPIPSKHTPWNVKRAQLEKESRDRAKLIRESKVQTVDDLEKELGVSDEVPSLAEGNGKEWQEEEERLAQSRPIS